jgi:ABC-type siderophore export system fused ATPase/permease subunit
MADENIVTWNVTNWITVVLMVLIGFLIVGVLQKFWASRRQAVAALVLIGFLFAGVVQRFTA